MLVLKCFIFCLFEVPALEIKYVRLSSSMSKKEKVSLMAEEEAENLPQSVI